ncbi:conserved hypothetical protein [uncultured Defluviicoccus sp.]|uniref:SRPBCC domain-containing protein n=1 Tax=metagenome TaxID=256318 RepID=A0A380T889_9ZZZZ|nr:conserved hypothetical protein [uncultured Defluviicoccus sp.]
MPKLEMEVEIAAPPERVWQVLANFEQYATWHPYLTIEGRAELYARIMTSWRLSGSDQRTMRSRGTVWRLDLNEKLELIDGNPLLYQSKQFFYLTPTDKGTLLRHGVVISGFWAAWRFSHGHKIERLRPYRAAFEEALIRRLAGKPSKQTGQGNRRSRRVQRAKKRSSHR